MQQLTCEAIATARGIERAVVAEQLRQTHTLTKCEKCQKHHKWVPGTVSDQVKASIEARLAFYIQVGPNRYAKVELKKKKNSKGSDDEDN